IHGQHQTLSLGENQYQFQVIDVLAKTANLLKTYKDEVKALKKLENKFMQIKEEQATAIKEHDYNLYLLKELQEAKLKEGQQEELEERSEELSNVELLTEHLSNAVNQLQHDEIGSLSGLKEVRNNLAKISGFSSTYSGLQDRVHSVIIELDDIIHELEKSLEREEANSEELVEA